MSHKSSTLPASFHENQGKFLFNNALIDTSFLTDKEKKIILNVIADDIKYNKEMLCSLEIAVSDGRELQSLKSKSSQNRVLCSCCGSTRTICDKLKGYTCYQCGNTMCKQCIVLGTKKIILCNVCYRERILDVQLQDFNFFKSNREKHLLSGSQLLQVSLKESPQKLELETKQPSRSPSALNVNTLPQVQTPQRLVDKDRGYHHVSVPSINDPNSGFKLMKSSISDENLAEISSLYSEPCYTDNLISGEVTFGVWFRQDEQTLYVRIEKAKGLGTIGGKVVNPYIKTHLLPGKSKHTKRKTAIQRKTANPEYNEIIKYKMTAEILPATTLWVSVWNWNINGRNEFLGEVKLPLSSSSIDLTKPKNIKYQLHDKEEEVHAEETDSPQFNGRLCIGLKFELMSHQLGRNFRSPSVGVDLADSLESRRLHKSFLDIASDRRQSDLFPIRKPLSHLELGVGGKPEVSLGKLWIRVKNAENLLSIDTTGNNNPFVRCFLLPKVSLGAKKKTKVVQKSLDPVWDEEFSYNFVSPDDLCTNRVLEVTVWDNDRRGENSFMGGLRIGPDPCTREGGKPEWMDSIGEEITHWEEMLDNAGQWVERWHILRPSMMSLLSTPKNDIKIEEKMGDDHLEGGGSVEGGGLVEGEGLPGDHPDAPGHMEGEEEGFKLLPKPLELNLTRKEKGEHYEISGSVTIVIDYSNIILAVKVCRASGLAAVNRNKTSNPYVKMYLLPDRHSKVKSKPKRKELDPIFDQTFKFKVRKNDLRDSSLWVTLWSYEGRFKHNQFLGETCISLETHEFSQPAEEISYKLFDYTKLDMIPNPSLSRRKSTVYRVRGHTASGTTPTLYDSSLDLTAALDDASENKEKSSTLNKPELETQPIPQISIERCSVERELVSNSTPAELSQIKSSTPVVEDPSAQPSVSSDLEKTPESARKPTAASGKPSTKDPHKINASKTPGSSSRSQVNTLPSNKRPPPQVISKGKYTTISASTKPSLSRKIPPASSTPKQQETKSSSSSGTPNVPSTKRSIKQQGRSDGKDSIISIHGNLI